MSDRHVTAPDIRNVFAVLDLVGRHAGVDRSLLMESTGLSKASLTRLIRAIRTLYDVRLMWDARAAEYHIADWGVFDGPRLMRHVRRLRRARA